MALKAAEGKRNILSITDFFIQTLVYYKHCGGGGEINNTSRKTLYRSIDPPHKKKKKKKPYN
jgi:hypothetical protein